MANWYKHDITAWMDGTEHLDDGPYRVYHVVCQLIYLNEGPIRVNEHGIAGRCKQPIRSFRANLSKLLELGLLTNSEGRLSNSRAKKELEKIGENRLNASKGGKANGKSLENNNPHQASLPEQTSLRLDETRPEETIKKKDGELPLGAVAPDAPIDVLYYRRAKQVLGPKAGGVARKILDAYDQNYSQSMILIEKAAGRENAMEYVSGALRRMHNPQTGIHPGL